MFRRCLAIVLLLAVIASSFQRYFVYAGFELNKSYIAKNLCENRNRPWLHCNGKCYFMRKLKAAEENEKKQSAKDNLTKLEISFFQESVVFNFRTETPIEKVKLTLPFYLSHYSSQYSSKPFQPPRDIA